MPPPPSSAFPARSRAKRPAATSSVNGSASIASRPWSEARQPRSWKNEWRFSSAARSASQVPIEAPAAFSSFPSQAVHAGRSSTKNALSGLQVGKTCVSGSFRCASIAWGSRVSVGSSVLQTTATRNCFRRPIAVKRVLLQPLVGAVEGRPRGGGGEERLDAERPAQLHVRPVVERVAEGVRDRAGPGLELLPVGGVARAEALGHPVRAHRPPLVVVALQPDLGDRAEAVVGRHQLGREVAVVVDDRQVPGDAVVEVPRGLRLQQEVVVDEGLHALLAQAVFSTGMGSNFGASTWWMAKERRYAKAQIENRMV